MRLAVAVSGGADSVALMRALALLESRASTRTGLVLSVVHMHHGIRSEAEADAGFVASLSASLGLRFVRRDVDTPRLASERGKGLEEAARTLRYGWFNELLTAGEMDAVATAHTLNDQAETVLHKLLRGAWTEGLAGIHPVLEADGPMAFWTRLQAHQAPRARAAAGEDAGEKAADNAPGADGTVAEVPAAGCIVRPLLGASRGQIVEWLQFIGQPWREDATNAELKYTRNRIRHQLLPELATYNPQIATQLAQVAAIARDEENYWQREVDRLLPGLLLPGRAVRGGGRSSSTLPGEQALSIEADRLRNLHPALVRRLLRAAARQLGVALDFEQTARLCALLDQRATSNPRREELTSELRAERTPRELRLLFTAKPAGGAHSRAPGPAPGRTGIEIPIPGEAEACGWRVRCALKDPVAGAGVEERQTALLRPAAAGDKVQLRYSRGAPKRVKEVLERMGIPASERADWPVLFWKGEIVWMAGAVLEPTPVSLSLVVEAGPVA